MELQLIKLDIYERPTKEKTNVLHIKLTQKVIRLLAQYDSTMLKQYDASYIAEEADDIGCFINFIISSK